MNITRRLSQAACRWDSDPRIGKPVGQLPQPSPDRHGYDHGSGLGFARLLERRQRLYVAKIADKHLRRGPALSSKSGPRTRRVPARDALHPHWSVAFVADQSASQYAGIRSSRGRPKYGLPVLPLHAAGGHIQPDHRNVGAGRGRDEPLVGWIHANPRRRRISHRQFFRRPRQCVCRWLRNFCLEFYFWRRHTSDPQHNDARQRAADFILQETPTPEPVPTRPAAEDPAHPVVNLNAALNCGDGL